MANMSGFRLKELLAAPFTPLLPDGEINFPLIKDYADYLVKAHFTGIFINGSLAEGMSMTLDERKRLAVAWKEASNGRLQLVVHVGANAIKDAQDLARHAEELGADAIAAFAPSYYKPENEEVMVEVMEQIAGVAPKTPFYYYDINFMTGCYINVRKFLELAKDRIPTLCGIKHSSRSLPNAHDCTLIENGNMQVLMGTNEQYLSVLSLGMPGTVIVSYLGPLFYELRKAFDAGDLKTVREKQVLCQKVQNIRNKYGGGMSAAKSVFKVLTGIDVGSVRLPLRQLGAPEISKGPSQTALIHRLIFMHGRLKYKRPRKSFSQKNKLLMISSFSFWINIFSANLVMKPIYINFHLPSATAFKLEHAGILLFEKGLRDLYPDPGSNIFQAE